MIDPAREWPEWSDSLALSPESFRRPASFGEGCWYPPAIPENVRRAPFIRAIEEGLPTGRVCLCVDAAGPHPPDCRVDGVHWCFNEISMLFWFGVTPIPLYFGCVEMLREVTRRRILAREVLMDALAGRVFATRAHAFEFLRHTSGTAISPWLGRANGSTFHVLRDVVRLLPHVVRRRARLEAKHLKACREKLIQIKGAIT